MEFQLKPEEFWTRYKQHNQKLSRQMIFHLGASAGLFSEINGMIITMVYCFYHGIGFKIYSGDANFTRDSRGWETFFLPAVPDCHESFHHNYNHRLTRLSWKNDLLKFFQAIPAFVLKRRYGFDYFTYELFEKAMQENWDGRIIRCRELNFSGDVSDACALFTHYLWRLNPETSRQSGELIRTLNLPEPFIAFQIRGGDKVLEADLPEPDLYIQKAEQLTSIRDAFILTDDYQIFEALQHKWKNWHFRTLAEKSEKGYYLEPLNQSSDETFRRKYISLIASMELFRRAEYFIGSRFPNPCLFANALRCHEKTVFIDSPEESGKGRNL